MPAAWTVLLPLPVGPLDWVAPTGAPPATAGHVAAVPWQRTVRLGLITRVHEISVDRTLQLNEAVALPGGVTPLPHATVDWLLAEAERTTAPAGTLLASLNHPAFQAEWHHRIDRLDAEPHATTVPVMQGDADPAENDGRAHHELREQGLLRETFELKRPQITVLKPSVHREPPDPNRKPGQHQAWMALKSIGSVASAAELARHAGVTPATVRSLIQKGHAVHETLHAEPAPPTPVGPPPSQTAQPDPPPAWISGGTPETALLELLPTFKADVAAGRSVLIIAPERLTIDAAADLLEKHVPTLRSGARTTPLERIDWQHAVAQHPSCIVTGFSGLIAPVPHPARLVVLEAENDTHKQRSGPRTWTPHAARTWANAHGVPLHLTDVEAGPETVALAGDNPPSSVAPGLRLDRPTVRWVASDLTQARGWPLGTDLVRVLRQTVERDRQALLIAPRRGYAAAYECQSCRAAVACPNCDLALRYHDRERRLKCHQCGHHEAPPKACSTCGAGTLDATRAAGVEWVARATRDVAPGVRTYRYDADIKDDLTALYNGQPGVVIGTTAALRLAPLPVLSLIAVTQIDGMLQVDDFRAEMRTLRMLAALETLAGRRRPLGLIQTFSPEVPLLTAIADPTGHAMQELRHTIDERRKRFGYPPYGSLSRVQASAKREADAWTALTELAAQLRTAGAGEHEVLGPAPMPVARLRGRYHAHLLLRASDPARARELLNLVPTTAPGGVRLRTDVDARDIGEVLD
jgi:primosomal protein N' (replication factor Y)